MKIVMYVVVALLLGAGVLFGMGRHHATAGMHTGASMAHGAMTEHRDAGIHGDHEMTERADMCGGCGGSDEKPDDAPKPDDEKKDGDGVEPCH